MKIFFNKIRHKIIEHKGLVQNFSSLSVLQIVGMVFPLITYTYLIRVLKDETYGLVIFAQAVVQYFVIFINYGFNISATQAIAVNKSDKKKISEIVSTVYIIKMIIVLVSFLIMLGLICFVPIFNKEPELFLFSMALCIQEAIFPVWYFLGIEKMKYITIINIISRLAFTALIFILVTQKTDYLLVPILNGVGGIIGGIYALYIVFKEKDITFSLQPISTLKKYFSESTYFFVSNISGMLYTNAGKFILGATGHMSEVAFYDIGEKVLGLVKNWVSIIEQTIFARISITKDIRLFNKIKNYTLLAVSFISIIIIIFSQDIILFLGGKEMLVASKSFTILIFSAIPFALSTFWGHIMLLAWNRKKDFLKLKIYSLLFFTILSFFTSLHVELNAQSLAWIFLINEIFVVICTFLFSKNIIYNSKKIC